LQLLALDNPNLLITAYPLVMVPAFAVPLAIMLHILSLRQLNRREQAAHSLRNGTATLDGARRFA
jgi:hypothetical protein